MTAQLTHDRLDRPPSWTVQSVFDPDGGGGEFAYTIGLHDLGLPELHIWARPDRGDDPGADWMLSMHDRARLLNELAGQLRDGRLGVGHRSTRKYDAETVVVALEVLPPGDRDALQAFGIHPEAQVLPVSWSLTRPPEGPLRPLTARGRSRAASEFRRAAGHLDRSLASETGWWRVPERPSFARGQEFGPLTPIVRARAALLWQSDVCDLNELLHHAVHVLAGGSLTLPISVARTAARAVGRRRALERLTDAVDVLVTAMTAGPRWSETVHSTMGPAANARQWADHTRQLSQVLMEVVLSCLAVEVVADAIDEEWLVAGRGPFLTALSAPIGELPGPAWTASEEVLGVVCALMGRLSLDQLSELAARHDRAIADDDAYGYGYGRVVSRLSGWAVVGPAGCPWQGTLSDLPGLRALGALRPGGCPPIPLLHEWATCLTSALTYRPRLTAAEVEAFVARYVDLVPDLASVLNQPAVTGVR